MNNEKNVRQGWDFTASLLGANVSSDMASDYISKINDAILALEDSVNHHAYKNLGLEQLKGYMAEEWHAGTFNINAIAAESTDRANVLHSLEAASVDIETNFGKNYSAKIYKDASSSAKAQSVIDKDTGLGAYYDQQKLVARDQLQGAKDEAHKQALRNVDIRPDVSESYNNTEHTLTDRVSNDKGIESLSMDKSDYEKMAKAAKGDEFKADDYDVTLDSVIKNEYILKKAFDAGMSSAVVSMVLSVAPEVYKTIDFLIKTGEIDLNKVKPIGTKAISSSAEGFIRGSVSCSLMILCEKGVLGEALRGISPSLLGTTVTILMSTIKNSILVASGQMTARQMGTQFVDTVVISAGYLAGAKIGGIIGQSIGVTLPVVGYLLGSLIGCAFSCVYNIGKNKLISFCVETGFTCFGLVEQDYSLPDEVLSKMGIDIIEIPRINIETIDYETIDVDYSSISQSIPTETIEFSQLRRGVIGVNKIGYVL